MQKCIRNKEKKSYFDHRPPNLSLQYPMLKQKWLELQELAFSLLSPSSFYSYPCQMEVLEQGVVAVLVDQPCLLN